METSDITVEVLRGIQTGISELKEAVKGVDQRLGGVQRRLGGVEQRLGDVVEVLGRSVTSQVDLRDRVESLESRVSALEGEG